MATTSYVDFKTAGDDPNGDFRCIEECLSKAVKCDGKIFGDYVRDVIYPLSVGKLPGEFYPVDINIWFVDRESMNSFRLMMGSNLKDFDHNGPDPNRSSYRLLRDGVDIARIYSVICNSFPEDDFDVNRLCYSGQRLTGPAWSVVYSRNESEISKILSCLDQRKMTMRSNWMGRLGGNRDQRRRAQLQLNKFLLQGWTIIAQDNEGDNVKVVSEHVETIHTLDGWRIDCSSAGIELYVPPPTAPVNAELQRPLRLVSPVKSNTICTSGSDTSRHANNTKSTISGDVLAVNLALLSEKQKAALMAIVDLYDLS